LTAAAPASAGTSRASRAELEHAPRAARRPAGLVGASVALAIASLLLPSAPGYDAWSWLIWGREVLGLELSTEGGPAWKPLPVAITALLTAVVGAAPEAWLVVARAGAILAVLLGRARARAQPRGRPRSTRCPRSPRSRSPPGFRRRWR